MSAAGRAVAGWLSPAVAEFTPGLLAIQQSPPPKLPRAVFFVVGTLFAALLAWSVLARLDIVAVAEGRLVPESYTKILQPAEAGIVKEVLVSEGQSVEEGQVLIRLDPTLAGADELSLASELAAKRLALRRIDAELRGVPLSPRSGDDAGLLAQVQLQALTHRQAYLDALAQEQSSRERALHDLKAAQETLAKLRSTSVLVQQSAEAHRRLAAEGFYSALSSNEKEREAIEQAQDLKSQMAAVQGLQSTLIAQERKISALSSNFRNQLQTERTEVMGQLARLEQDSRKLKFKAGLLELRAPKAGTVKDIATTTLGAVVQPGMVLLTLVPRDEPLVAEVQVRNDDVGFVRAGQPVKLKIAAYPFQKHGLLEGRVRTVAADAQTGDPIPHQATAQGYKAVVVLESQALLSEGMTRLRLESGMQVAAEVQQGQRTVLEYLLSPVQRTAQEAGRER
jgi:HlyD family secretion protein